MQYKGDHLTLGFWYNWIKYKDRFEKFEKGAELLRCGDSFPIFWHERKEGPLLGYVDNKTEIGEKIVINEFEVVHFPQLNSSINIAIFSNKFFSGLLMNYSAITSARFSHDGKVEEVSGGALNDMLIIVRELKGGPPNCVCHECSTGPPKPVVRVTLDEWADFRYGDPWPATGKPVQALDRYH